MKTALSALRSNPTVIFLFILLVASAVLFNRLGSAYLAGDDTYYSEIAKEMAISGDFLTPHYAGHIDFHTSKPPLLFWMNAVSGKIFGFTSFAMRLPSALLGLTGILALFLFARRYFGLYEATASALILTFTQQYLYHARSAVTDGPFAVFFSVALMAFWVARTENRAWWYYLMGLCMGLAVMTRQVPGFFIFPVIGAYIIFSREYGILKNPHFIGGCLLSAAVFLPWHLVMIAQHGQVFISNYFGVTLKTGIFGYPAAYSANPALNPWYAYFDILLSNYWPWIPFFIWGLLQSVSRARKTNEPSGHAFLFLLCWSIVPFVLFQLVRVKQYHYIVPLYVPFALVSAAAFTRARASTRMKAGAGIAIFAACGAVITLAFPILPKTLDSREYTDAMRMAPLIASTQGSIFATERHCCHYNSCFLFYTGRKILGETEDRLIELLRSSEPCTVILDKKDWERLHNKVPSDKVSVVYTTDTSVLVRNTP